MGGYTAPGGALGRLSAGQPWESQWRPGEAWGALGELRGRGEPCGSRALPADAAIRNTTPSADPRLAKVWVNLGASAALNPKR